MNFDTTQAPVKVPPTVPIMPTQRQVSNRCLMDDITEERFDEALHRLKVAFGLTDKDINAALYGDKGSPMFGNMSDCKAVKIHRVLAAIAIGIQAMLLITVLWLLKDGGDSDTTVMVFHGFMFLTALMTIIELRDSLHLSLKVLWYGSGTNTRASLILSAILMVCMFAFRFAQEYMVPFVVLLAFIALVIIAKIVFSARLLANPEANYVIASSSALNRVISARKLSKLRQGLVI